MTEFTVFTPTYNRAHTLPRVYASLRAQTSKDFEWLIVDDGSTDNTREMVNQWQSECREFDIRYFFQKNQHKKVAHNRAVAEARGELFVVLDSDDTCIPNALERFREHWSQIVKEQRERFSGIWCLCKYSNGEIVGDHFPGEAYIDSDLLEIVYRYSIRGEKWCCNRTDVLREHLFREDLPGLVPEGTVWSAIAKKYKSRFVNDALRIYHLDVPGVIARSGERSDPSRDAAGAVFSKQCCLEYAFEYFLCAPKEFLMEAARLTRFWLHCSYKMRQYVGYWPNTYFGSALVFIAAPSGFAMWIVDHLRRLRQRKLGAT